MAIRLAVLPFLGFPEPFGHDEFSYLLGADTFASGRLTNPTHPLWTHFETVHENFVPTYMTKYPPAQSLVLALGQKLLGHPWFGVWLSFGLMCGCLCWMLQGWLPSIYALLGTLVAIGQMGMFGYWMNSYWGGAVAAAGGCLLLGAVPRLARNVTASSAVAAALGVVILANSRPFEGLIVTLLAGVVLFWWRLNSRHMLGQLFQWRAMIPFLSIVSAGTGWMAYYNYKVTGNPLLMPYVVNERNYSSVSTFLFMPPRKPLVYRNDEIRAVWTDFDRKPFLKERANPLTKALVFFDVLPFYYSKLVFFGALAAVCMVRSKKLLLAEGIIAVFWLVFLTETFGLPHYVAPLAGLMFIPPMFGVRLLRVRAPRFGSALALLFVAVVFGCGLLEVVDAYRLQLGHAANFPRRQILNALLARPGPHLVIVQYAAGHNFPEYVYNAADIDASAIVWARDMGDAANRQLIRYYPRRRVWLLRADSHPWDLTPYSTSDAAGAAGNSAPDGRP